MKEKILVTGGGGFVGRELVGRLRSQFPDCTVIAAGTSGGGVDDKFIRFDLRDRASIHRLVGSVRPSVLVHLAGLTHVQEAQNSAELAWLTNVMGVSDLAEEVLRFVPDCKFVYISSGDVYGVAGNGIARLNEESPVCPANRYAVTKYAAEIALQEIGLRGLRLVRARPFNHTGPSQENRFVVPRIVSQVAEIVNGLRDPILRLGALDRSRDFLHVHDVCDAYCTIVGKFEDIEGVGVINICSGEARTIQSIVSDVLRLAGVSCEIVTEPSAIRAVDVVRLCGDPIRANKLLSWIPRISWPETLQQMLDAHMQRQRPFA